MKIVLSPALSLDGFLADLDGDCYSWVNPADEERYEQHMHEFGCELVGRKTYEQYRDNFDTRKDVSTFVYTSQDGFEDKDKIKFVKGTPAEIVEKIGHHGFENILLSGGGELNGSLAEANLIDEIIISFHPVVLGEGIPLFGSHKPQLKLELVATNQDVPGIVQNVYNVLK